MSETTDQEPDFLSETAAEQREHVFHSHLAEAEALAHRLLDMLWSMKDGRSRAWWAMQLDGEVNSRTGLPSNGAIADSLTTRILKNMRAARLLVPDVPVE